MQINSEIFRAYDIRGQIDKTLTTQTAFFIGRATGSYAIKSNARKIAVGRDGRLSSPILTNALIDGLKNCGCDVVDFGMLPTPMLYSTAYLDDCQSSIMVTGSHNPPDYNGFKITIAGDSLAGNQIQDLYQLIKVQNFVTGLGSANCADIYPAYKKYITDTITLKRKLKVVVDCGNGVAGAFAPQIIADLGCEVIPLFCEVDGNFPNHHPDPAKIENLQDLINTVKVSGADVGLAFDGDGDRVGVITHCGQMIYPDVLLQLFAQDVLSRNSKAQIIFDVKCSQQVAKTIHKAGGVPIMWQTGHSLIKKKMRETCALLGGEMSGHIFFKERWFGFDDGIYSAVRLLEILSNTDQDSTSLFAQFYQPFSTPEINIAVDEKQKFAIIEDLQQITNWDNGKICVLDGIRVDYADGFGLIRASNTTPILVARFEAETQKRLEQIQHIFVTNLRKVAPQLEIFT